MCMHNVLGNRAIEVLANHLLLAVEQNQSWQVCGEICFASKSDVVVFSRLFN